MTTTAPGHASTLPALTRAYTRGLAVGAATLAAVTGWLVAVPIPGVDLIVRPNGGAPMAVGPGPVVATALLAALLGWALLAALERLTARARTIWTTVAVVVLVLSLAGPLTAAASAAAATTLVALHLAVGAVVIPTLHRSARSR